MVLKVYGVTSLSIRIFSMLEQPSLYGDMSGGEFRERERNSYTDSRYQLKQLEILAGCQNWLLYMYLMPIIQWEWNMGPKPSLSRRRLAKRMFAKSTFAKSTYGCT